MASTSTPAHINERLQLYAFVPEVTQGTPNWSFTATGGSGTTVTVNTAAATTHDAAIASAADDFFNGLQIYFKANTTTAALRGLVYAITDFAVSGGTATFTTGTMAASPANTDTFCVIGVLPATSISISPKTENLERDFARQTLDPPSSLKGLTTASVSFDVEIPGLVTPSADGSAAGIDRVSQFLTAFGSRSAKVGEAVTGAGSTTSQIDVTDVTPYAVGDLVLISNQIRRVTAVNAGATPDNMTVSPALSAAPAAATVIYLAETFTPADSGHRALTFLHLVDDRLIEVRGCVGSLKLSSEYGSALKASYEGDGSVWDLQDAFALDGSQIAKYPPVYKVAGAQYFGTTLLNTRSWEFDLGHGRAETRDTGVNVRFDIRTRKAMASVSFRDIALTPKETWEASATQGYLLLACGNASGDAIAVGGNAQIQDPAEAQNQNDTRYWQASFGFVDDQTDAATPSKPVIARF